MSVQVYYPLSRTEGEKESLFLRVQEEGAHSWGYSQEYFFVKRDEKSLSFCEIGNNKTSS